MNREDLAQDYADEKHRHCHSCNRLIELASILDLDAPIQAMTGRVFCDDVCWRFHRMREGIDQWDQALDDAVYERQQEAAASQRSGGAFSFGSDVWPGLGKLAEECSEVIQVIGKLIATGGAAKHWDGSNLKERLQEEIADSLAAIEFVIDTSNLDRAKLASRRDNKYQLFKKWHREGRD